MKEYNGASEYLRNVFTTAPASFDWGEALLWSAGGVGLALLAAALPFYLVLRKKSGEERRKFFRRRGVRIMLALLLIAGGGGGFGLYALKQSAVENLGDYFVMGDGRIAAYEEIFGAALRPGRDDPPVDYLVYVPGAVNGKRDPSDIVNTGTRIIVPYGHAPLIKRFAESLRPCDRLHLIGFSRGGEAVLEVAARIDRPVDTLVALDPIGFSPFGVKSLYGSYRKPDNVRHFLTIGAIDYDNPKDPGVVAIGNGKYLMAPLADITPAEYTRRVGHGHSMYESGWRFPEDPAGLEQIFAKIRREFYGD